MKSNEIEAEFKIKSLRSITGKVKKKKITSDHFNFSHVNQPVPEESPSFD